jgi:ABC-type antimicrobial peptide transport system permease subunit
LETKFEYQVSPELAEAIAIEQLEMLFPKRLIKLRYLPMIFGFLFALASFLLPSLVSIIVNFLRGPSTRYMQVGGYAFTESFLFVPIGFVLGFAFGLLFSKFLQAAILAAARSAYGKMGPARTISWNAETITFHSLDYEVKVRWRMIDRIDVGYVGVYGFSGRRALFAIPKDAFPANVTTEELTRAWQSHRVPPAIKA